MGEKTEKPSTLLPTGELRRRAEKRFRTQKTASVGATAETDVVALVHELQVHQIELEMQNEELRAAQAAIEEASQKYRNLFDFAPVGYFLWDQKGRILEANLAGAALLGLDRNLVVHKRLGEFVAPEHRARFAAFCKRVLASDVKQSCEIEILKDGQAVFVLIEGIAAQDRQGQERLCRATAVNIDQQRLAAELAVANQALQSEIASRQQAEEQLQESESRYRRLFHDSPISLREEDYSEVRKHLDQLRSAGVTDFRAYFEKHPEAVRECAEKVRVLDVNQAGLHLFGATSRQELLAGLAAVFTDETYDSFRELLIAAANRATVMDAEAPVRTLQGEKRQVLLRWMAAPGSETTLAKVYVSQTDITERKRANEVLRQANLYNRSLIEASVDPLVTIGPNGKITDVNQATEEATGCGREQLVGTDFSDYFTEPGRAREGYRQAFRQGKVRDYALELRHRDGSLRSVLYNASTYQNEAGEVIGVFAVARDITQRKKVEEALRQSEQRYRFLFDNMLDGFAYCTMLFDDQGRPADFLYLAVNNAFERLTGLKDVVGKRVTAVIPGIKEASPELFEVYGRVAMSGKPEKFDFDFKSVNAWLSISVYGVEKGYFVALFDNITERKRAVESLKENETKLRTLFTILPAGVSILDEHHNIVDCNPALEKLLSISHEGLLRGEYAGRRYIGGDGSPMSPEDFPSARAVRDGAVVSDVEVGVVKEDGTTVWTSVSSAPLPVRGLGAAVVTIDVTDRKLAEERLRTSHERLKLAQQAARAGLWDWDLVTRKVTWSEELYELFGLAPTAGASLDTWLAIIHPDDRELAMARIHRDIEERTPHQSEYRIVRPDGKERWIDAFGNASYDGDCRPIRMSGIYIDITDRKRAEEEVMRKNSLLAAQQEASIDGILAVDGNDKVILFNRRFVELWNVPLQLVESQDDRSLLQWVQGVVADPDVFLAKVRHLYDHRRERSRDEITLIDGRVFDRYSAPIFGPGDQYYGRVWYFRDITDRKRAEEELRNYAAELETANKSLEKANRLAEAANRAKSQFLANMSHEIRTPMTAILGFADLLDGEVTCCPECPKHGLCPQRHIGREAVSTIHRNGKHLLAVINDILDLSKIESQKLQIELTCCSPVQLVAEVVSLMRPQAVAKRLKLKTELAHPLPETVLTDPVRLRQVLVNLVSNAIKFTDQGEVCLAVRLRADNGGLGLCFDVTDTGIGMNAEQIEKLFQPFNQVDNSSTRKFGGTGLGLCISQHLAAALGGDIKVRSEPGKGSTFSVRIDPESLDEIPIIGDAQGAAIQPPPAQPADAARTALHGRILLAEDGLDNQQLIAL